jgi:uncharacterized ferritin-like protein (DUF455 family)
MALVPRTLEARGLDATPPIQAKLAQGRRQRAVEILDVILRDEVATWRSAIAGTAGCATREAWSR